MENVTCPLCGVSNVVNWSGPYCWDCQKKVTITISHPQGEEKKEDKNHLNLSGTKLVLRVSEPKEEDGVGYVTVAVTLSQKNNTPIEGVEIRFFLDEVVYETLSSEEDGNASLVMRGIEPGSHTVSAQVVGTTIRKDKKISISKPKEPVFKIHLEHTDPVTDLDGKGSVILTAIVSRDDKKEVNETISFDLNGRVVADMSSGAGGKAVYNITDLIPGQHVVAAYIREKSSVRQSDTITVLKPIVAADFDMKILEQSPEETEAGEVSYTVRMWDKDKNPCAGTCVLSVYEKGFEKRIIDIVIPLEGYVKRRLFIRSRTKFFIESPPLERTENFDVFGPPVVKVSKRASKIAHILLGLSILCTFAYFNYFSTAEVLLGATEEERMAQEEFDQKKNEYEERLSEYNAYVRWGDHLTAQKRIQRTRKLQGLPPIPQKPEEPVLPEIKEISRIDSLWELLWLLWATTILMYLYASIGGIIRAFRWGKKRVLEDLEGDTPEREGRPKFWEMFSGGIAPLADIFRSLWFFRRRR